MIKVTRHGLFCVGCRLLNKLQPHIFWRECGGVVLWEKLVRYKLLQYREDLIFQGFYLLDICTCFFAHFFFC